MYRNYTVRKGKTASFNPALGDIVFKWRAESSKLPERYRGDGIGDMYHVGIVTQATDGKYVVCHSSNSTDNGKRDVFSSLDALARTWQYAGTLKNTGALEPESVDGNEVNLAAIQETANQIEKLVDQLQAQLTWGSFD